MDWFVSWWNSLDIVLQIYACIAIPSTIILILQTILLLFGLGLYSDSGEFSHDVSHDYDHDVGHDHDYDYNYNHEHDYDAGHDHDHDHDAAQHAAGLRLFTIRGIVSMLAVGGWIGFVLVDCGVNPVISGGAAIAGGLLTLVFVAWVIKLMYTMQESGTVDLKNAVAMTGKVYITIPPNREGTGKILINLQGALTETEAMTDYDAPLKPDTQIQVVAVNSDVLIVRPLSAPVSMYNKNKDKEKSK